VRTLFGICAALTVALVTAQGEARADTIYTTVGGNQYGTIDTSTAAGTVIGSTGYSGTYGNAIDLDGTHYATPNSNKLGIVNTSTGAVTVLGSLPEFDYAIDFDNQGNLYGLATSGNLFLIDKTNGSSLGLVGSTGISATMDISIDSSNRLWATVGGRLYEVDKSTGAVISNIAITGSSGVIGTMGLMHGTDGTAYITNYASNGNLWELNTTTGAATLVGSTGLYLPHGGDITSGNPIPEPGTFALFGAALIGFGIYRRRRNSA